MYALDNLKRSKDVMMILVGSKHGVIVSYLPSGNGKSPFLIGKSTINVPFSIAMLNYQRVIIPLVKSCKWQPGFSYVVWNDQLHQQTAIMRRLVDTSMWQVLLWKCRWHWCWAWGRSICVLLCTIFHWLLADLAQFLFLSLLFCVFFIPTWHDVPAWLSHGLSWFFTWVETNTVDV